MQEQITILSAEQYFQKYAVEGIGKGADRWMIRRQLIDAFHKEIFGLTALRTGKLAATLPEDDPQITKITKNIIHDATRKWVKLCKMFARFKETANLLNENDLRMYDEIEDIGTTAEELMEQQEENEEDVGDEYDGEEAPTDPGNGESDGEDRGTDEDAEGYSAGTEADEQAPAEEVNTREEHAE